MNMYIEIINNRQIMRTFVFTCLLLLGMTTFAQDANFHVYLCLGQSNMEVNGGLAYSLVIEGAVPFWNQSKVTFRPLDPPLTATSVLAWKRGQPFSLATTKFIKHIQCFLGMDKP